MDIKTVYHGSQVIVTKPDIDKSRSDTDYGKGFYCTEDPELAKEWACDETHSGYINHYEIDVSSLRILNLNKEGYSPLHWLALLVKNRKVRIQTPLQRSAIDWLLKNYLPDIGKYDIIIGYRADDSYFSIVRSFLMNSISLEQLTHSLKLGGWGDQFVIKSEKAYAAIRFINASPVDHDVYYPKKKRRNEAANAEFRKLLEEMDMNGSFIRDLMKEV